MVIKDNRIKKVVAALNIIKRITAKFKKLRTKDRIMAIAALALTMAVMIAVPTMAWFAHQKQIATMAKINSPSKLSLKSGAREDIIQFKMSGIDTTKGSSKDFVFCVEGEDISNYNIQLAHTTNINFSYKLYKATESSDSTGVEYLSENGSVYYTRRDELDGGYVNNETKGTRTIGNDEYEKPSYDDTNIRQDFAEPLYWQSSMITAEDETYDDDQAERSFRNYYILEVSWGNDVTNDKETDLIYLTAQVA